MEHEGLVRAVALLEAAGLQISQIMIDRHKQNTAWIKRNLPNTKHYFDIWHVAKGKIVLSQTKKIIPTVYTHAHFVKYSIELIINFHSKDCARRWTNCQKERTVGMWQHGRSPFPTTCIGVLHLRKMGMPS